MLVRCLAIQGSWNYELMMGNGIGFCVEPALRRLPGGVDGALYREALARQSAYFNAHPYLAGLAVGALARAEVDLVPPSRIVRFRTALCGPLGAVGDRLVWAAWLPACSLLALLVFGLGVSPYGVVAVFLIVYNVGHLVLRDWALRAGWQHGLRVASALAHPVLQHGPRYIGRVAAVTGGRSQHVTDMRRLSAALVTIALELRSQYLLGYVPTRPLRTGEEWRSIRVRVGRPDVRVRAREGYVARRR